MVESRKIGISRWLCMSENGTGEASWAMHGLWCVCEALGVESCGETIFGRAMQTGQDFDVLLGSAGWESMHSWLVGQRLHIGLSTREDR